MVFDGVAVYDGGAGISSEEQGFNQGKRWVSVCFDEFHCILEKIGFFLLVEIGLLLQVNIGKKKE